MHFFSRKFAFSIIIGSIILFFLGCTRDTEGIFYSLEHEQRAVDNTLPNDLRITGNMIKTFVGGGRYYICAGSLFFRSTVEVGANPWTRIASPIRGGIVSGVAEVGGRIFVSVSSGDAHGLFRLDPTGNFFEGTNLYPHRQITSLFSLNNFLFISAGTVMDAYQLLFWDGSAVVPTGVDTFRIVAGAWDGVNYWFAGPADLFRFSTHPSPHGWSRTPYYSYSVHAATGAAPHPALGGKTYFRDLFVDSTPPGAPPFPLYLASSDGFILKTKDGGTTWISSLDHNRAYQSITRVGNLIAVGAGRNGLRELPHAIANNLDTVELPGGNFARLPELSGSSILRVFGFGNLLFAGTAQHGLWKGDYTVDPATPVWSQE